MITREELNQALRRDADEESTQWDKFVIVLYDSEGAMIVHRVIHRVPDELPLLALPRA